MLLCQKNLGSGDSMGRMSHQKALGEGVDHFSLSINIPIKKI